MKRFLQQKPVHSFLIGLYIIFFIFVQNLEQVTLQMTYRSIGITLVLTALIFFFSWFVLKSYRKAGVFTTLLIIGFFIYGAIYNGLEAIFYKGLWPFQHIHRFLVIAYLVVYLLLCIALIRSRRSFISLTYGLNVFMGVVFLWNTASGFLVHKKNHLVFAENPFLKNSQPYRGPMPAYSPDVYYIILDGFASEHTLKKFYGGKGRFLYDSLRSKGFYISDSSHTNYPATAASLSSSLNMNFPDEGKNIPSAYELIRQNLVSYTFKQMGYRVINIKSGFALSGTFTFADKTIKIAGFNEFERRLLELTVLRLDDVLGLSRYKQLHDQLDQLNLFTKEAGPKFCFIHIVAPHPPFVVDSLGNRKIRSTVSDMAWEPRQDYINQLQYVSKRVDTFIDSILSTAKTPPVIIVQSDHGPWIKDKEAQNVYDARTGVLNAYYVPDSLKTHLYKQISPVNSFRVLFTQLFHMNYVNLPDKPVPFSEIAKNVTFQKYQD